MASSGHRVINSLLVGIECEYYIIWYEFNPCGACLNECDCKMVRC